MKRVAASIIAAAFAAVIGGCARPICLGLVQQRHPAVEWIFDAGYKVDWVFHVQPYLAAVSLERGAYRDGKIILVDYGRTSAELISSSRILVISAGNGHLLKSFSGPQEIWTDEEHPPPITEDMLSLGLTGDEDMVYLGLREGKYQAFDLEKGRIVKGRHDPPADMVVSGATFLKGEYTEEPEYRRWQFTGKLAGDLGLTVTSKWSGPNPILSPGTLTYDLSYTDEKGSAKTVRLCRLDSRRFPGMQFTLVNDKNRLIFASFWYVICVDLEKLRQEED